MAEQVSRILSGDLLPPRLQDLPEPPPELHLLGELPRGASVAIVGTRRPSVEGFEFARGVARELAEAGLIILSGGANGIDTAAHLGALDAGGRTVVVAPAGHRKPFPAENAELFRTIVEAGGAYLSLLPPDEPAPRGGFFFRNACLVALSHAVVVVEAPVRSGARNAAAWARRIGRPLLAVPSAPWISSGGGCILELRLGASFCTGLKDVLRVLEESFAIPAGAVDAASEAEDRGQLALPFGGAGADGELVRVIRAIEGGARHADGICEASGLAPATVQRHILTLTLEGVLVADPAGGLGIPPARRPV